MNGVVLDPPWKQALVEFLATNPQPGDLVTRTQLERWFGIKVPARLSLSEARNIELQFLANRDRWADELLRRHQIQFSEKDREEGGWRVLAPEEVARFTRKAADRDLRKALRKQRDRLAHTNLANLTPAQLVEHAETLVRSSRKLQALKDEDRRPVELPALPKALPRRNGS